MCNLGNFREVAESELDLILSWRNYPTVRANMYTSQVISHDEHLAWWAGVQESDEKTYFMYEYNDIPAGVVGFVEINLLQSNCSWAFYASPSAPRGTGSRMEYLALDYVFGELQLHKLNCEVLAFNTAVLKLHHKFGFKTEGIFRDQHRINDEYVDVYRLGMMSVEWESHKDIMAKKLRAFESR